MLEVAGLECVRGDRRLFSGLSFGLAPGEMLHLHGHNGSGKTTLMRAVCGLFRPTAGEVRWKGEGIHRLGEDYHRELTYLGHRNGIKDDLSGVENLRIACALDGTVVTPGRVWEALQRMGLRGHEDLPSRVLSQGQKRRVALARLLLTRAPLWILDEPFTALDRAAVGLLQSLVRGHVEGGGMVILTTHQEVVLSGGRVKQLQLGWKGAHGDV